MATDSQLPYINAYGNITKVLDKIQEASTPERFTHDFLATKLGMTGGSAKPLVPFLKRTGFLGGDGIPTAQYKRFRNKTERGAAAAEALHKGYKSLYEVNEYAHDAEDGDLKGIVVQITGLEPKSSTVRAIVNSFKAVRAFADFDSVSDGGQAESVEADAGEGDGVAGGVKQLSGDGLRLGYTINLNLPATSDIAVFNAIFKSLREHILPE